MSEGSLRSLFYTLCLLTYSSRKRDEFQKSSHNPLTSITKQLASRSPSASSSYQSLAALPSPAPLARVVDLDRYACPPSTRSSKYCSQTRTRPQEYEERWARGSGEKTVGLTEIKQVQIHMYMITVTRTANCPPSSSSHLSCLSAAGTLPVPSRYARWTFIVNTVLHCSVHSNRVTRDRAVLS
jgi:hypothetical protein